MSKAPFLITKLYHSTAVPNLHFIHFAKNQQLRMNAASRNSDDCQSACNSMSVRTCAESHLIFSLERYDCTRCTKSTVRTTYGPFPPGAPRGTYGGIQLYQYVLYFSLVGPAETF
eukprot:COSAG01_NODE_9245_length_2503_cov_28.917324_4_plen_115_part_00